MSKMLVIVPREEWSDPPEPVLPLEYFDTEEICIPVDKVILSYTGTPTCYTNDECKKAMRELHVKFKQQGVYEMPYNFVVGGDGTVYEARGWKRTPGTNEQYPSYKREAYEFGHFGVRGKPPGPDHIHGSWSLLLYGIQRKFIIPDPDRFQQFLN